MGWYGWLYILFMIPTDELLNPPRNLKTLFCCSLLISKLLCLWHGWMFLSISDRLMRKPQTRRPPHTRRLLVERNSLPSCYMNFGSSMQMMYYTTPLNKFTRFLDEHPDFVCAFCSCCSTGSGDCWSEGQSKGCYGDLSKQIILMLSSDAASILGMCSLFRNMYGYYMQSNARDTAKYSRTSQNSQNWGLHISRWDVDCATTNNEHIKPICTPRRWRQQHEAMPLELPQRLSMPPGWDWQRGEVEDVCFPCMVYYSMIDKNRVMCSAMFVMFD